MGDHGPGIPGPPQWRIEMYTLPSVSDFKTYYHRDFPFGPNPNEVNDADVTNAMQDANVNMNQNLFGDQTSFTSGFLALSAHYLVMNLRASAQGIAGNFPWLTSSKAVGSVSEGISIPQRLLDNPYFAFLAKTYYGNKYLMFVIPSLSGQVQVNIADANP